MILAKSFETPRAETTLSAGQIRSFWTDLMPGSAEEAGQLNRAQAERLSPVAAAHRILTNSFGLIPFGLYQREGNSRKAVNDPALDQLLKVRPTEMMSPFLFRKLLMSNAFWEGWGAVWNRRDPSGKIVERIVLPTAACTVTYDSAADLYWYTYNVKNIERTFAPSELSFLFFESYDGVVGRGIKALAAESIQADNMAQRYNKKFYQNGARIGGIVEVDNDADRETRDTIRSQFQAFAKDDAFKVAVLDHGMKYTPIGLNQTDAQYIESRSFTVEEVSRFTGIPKYMLQTGKEAYNSNAQQRVDFVTDTLLPYVTAWEQEESYKLLRRDQLAEGMYVRGNVSVLLRGDDQSRAEFYTKMIASSVYNPDECRALEERDPIPDGLGERFFMTKNLGSLESIVKGES